MSISKLYVLVIASLFLVSCSSGAREINDLVNLQKGKFGDVRVGVYRSQNFSFVTVGRGDNRPDRIYIEGDGRAYISQGVPSSDPTPRNPVGLELAFSDDHKNVVYLGRPCQWEKGPDCRLDKKIWTERRFTKDVADAYVEAIGDLTDGQPVELVGFSGGAWVALQVASRLDNVTKVITVAGNMSPNWVNKWHRVSALDVAPYEGDRLKNIPIDAYVGVYDNVVNAGVVDAFREQTGAHNIQVFEWPAKHVEGWKNLKL
jgi:pimeloyl-ACP methyl ester carboxylesterase